MTNRLGAPVDYDAVLADLEAQKQEIDAAIAAIERIRGRTGNGGKTGQSTTGSVQARNGNRENVPSTGVPNIKTMSIYASTVALIENEKKPLTTRELYNRMVTSGKTFVSENPVDSIAGTLYKAMRSSPNCRLMRVDDGWALRA